MTIVRIGGRSFDIGSALDSLGRANCLPAEFYLDPELFGLECERIFRPGWLPVARIDRIPVVGSYIATAACGEQLVVVRTAEETVRVFSNVCRHRSMTMMNGSGRTGVIQCPYHLWTYRLDGSLSGAPLMERKFVTEASVSLPEFPCEVWNGWVFVNLGRNAASLAPQLSSLEDVIKPWGFPQMSVVASAEYIADWNWKISVENFIEYYHHLGLHRESLEAFLPSRSATTVDGGGQPWTSSWVDCSEEYLTLGTQRDLPSPYAQRMQIFSVFPLLCAGAQPESGFWLELLPESVDRHVLRWHVMCDSSRSGSDLEEFIETSLRAIDLIQREDAAACRSVQLGLKSRSSAPGRLIELERGIWDTQRWLLGCLVDAPDTVANGGQGEGSGASFDGSI